MTNNKFGPDDLLYIAPWFAEKNRSKYLRAGDVVTVRTGNAGVSAVLPPNLDRSQCFTLLMTTLRPQADPHFYCELLNSSVGTTYFALEGWGTAQQNISVPILADMPVPEVPLAEQLAIVAHIRAATCRIDAAVAALVRQIGLLREYRQALITAAVTGKIDLRGDGRYDPLPDDAVSASLETVEGTP